MSDGERERRDGEREKQRDGEKERKDTGILNTQ